jgi:hypothetical protein
MRNYDRWLEEPYERLARQLEAAHCPECDNYSFEDEGNGEGQCSDPECGYSRYRDYDSEPGGHDWID